MEILAIKKMTTISDTGSQFNFVKISKRNEIQYYFTIRQKVC